MGGWAACRRSQFPGGSNDTGLPCGQGKLPGKGQGSQDQGAGRSGEADGVVESAHFIFSAENEQADTPAWTGMGTGDRHLHMCSRAIWGIPLLWGPWCLSCVRLRRR